MIKKLTKGQKVTLTSKYLRAIRGHGLRDGESPIDLALKCLRINHRQDEGESNDLYLFRMADVMRAHASKNKTRKPKRAKDSFLETYEWRKVRMEALIKYGPKCMCCGATPKHGAVMNVDHIKPRLTHPELALKLDNLQILCNECNHGKGNWDTTDWRPADRQ